MGSSQIALTALDHRAQKFDLIAPRTDPLMEANFQDYWAFHNPILPLAVARPAGDVFSIDSLIPRQELCPTIFYNEWYRPANFQLAMLGANLHAENQISTLLFASNMPGDDNITSEQTLFFKAAVRHINRAIRIHRELRLGDLDHDTAPDRLDRLHRGVMLVDGTSRVMFANAAARRLLNSTGGLTLKGGCLCSTDGSDARLQGLIVSCKRDAKTRNDPGGEISIRAGPRRSLRVTVTPLRAKGAVAELPWLGVLIPMAIVTVSAPSTEISLN